MISPSTCVVRRSGAATPSALADPHGVIVKHKGHAIISFNGKSYEQTYINEVRVRNGKITLYVEYFDTAVLNAALAP